VRDDESVEVELGGEADEDANPCVGVLLEPRPCMYRLGECMLAAGELGLLVGSNAGAAGLSAPTVGFTERTVLRVELTLLWNPTLRRLLETEGEARLCTLDRGL
jgi:hypothetical protein